MTRYTAILAALVLCVACAPRPQMPASADQADLSREIVRGARAPQGGAGVCWAEDNSPAVIETVTEQVRVTPEERAADGTVVTPATYRTKTATRMLRDRQTIWFRAPCPEEFTPEFIASLQRALKARGYFMAVLTGVMDSATIDGLRRFQTERGLDSRQLSLAAARQLGLVTVDLETL